jgi:hypothetical protein
VHFAGLQRLRRGFARAADIRVEFGQPVLRGLAAVRGTGAISTRRFCARPCSVAFEATGCSAPNAAANTCDAGMPSSISARVTVSARCADNSRLSS